MSTDQTEMIQKYIDGAKSKKMINLSSHGHQGYEKYSVIKEKRTHNHEDFVPRADHR